MRIPVTVFTTLLFMVISLPGTAAAIEKWTQIRYGNSTKFQPYAVAFAGSGAWAYRAYHNKSYLKKMIGSSPTSWQDLRTFTFRINALNFKNNQLGFIAGDGGRLIRSQNGGNVWYPANYTTTKNLMDIDIRGNNIWVVGQDNTIAYSPDNGVNWQEINPGLRKNNTFTGVSFSTPKMGWITGYQGSSAIILHTRNGGKNWAVQTGNIQNATKKFIPRDIHATEAGWVYIVGTKASFIMTTDEGKTWKPALNLRLGEKTTLNKIAFPVSRIGWITGDHGRVLKTIDAGFHWDLEPTPIRACEGFCNILDIHMMSPQSGYAFTNWGDVIKYAPQ